MKVYVVESGCKYEGGEVKGVYSTKEEAHKHADYLRCGRYFGILDYARVYELDVMDKFNKKREVVIKSV